MRTMVRSLVLTVLGLLLTTGLAVAQCKPAGGCKPASSSTESQGHQKTLTGVVSDAMCGAKHLPGQTAAACTRMCVSKGSKYALVVGSKVYTLEGGPADELDKLAGEKAKVTGTVAGDTIQVSSVAPAKKSTKKG